MIHRFFLYMKTTSCIMFFSVIYNICDDWDLDFFAMYACVGLWNMMFLLLYAVSDASRLMKWSTRLVSMDSVIRIYLPFASLWKSSFGQIHFIRKISRKQFSDAALP